MRNSSVGGLESEQPAVRTWAALEQNTAWLQNLCEYKSPHPQNSWKIAKRLRKYCIVNEAETCSYLRRAPAAYVEYENYTTAYFYQCIHSVLIVFES